MKYKYRVKGLIQKSFILRGIHFRVGENMDFYIYENQLEFIKERVKIEDLIDVDEKLQHTPEPVLVEENTQTESKPKGVKNGLPKTNKRFNKINA